MADSMMKTQETNVMLFITMKMYRCITVLDFKSLVTDLCMTGNKTFCQTWSRNQEVSEADVNGFWHHLTDSTWMCYRHMRMGAYCVTQYHIGTNLTQIFCRNWSLTWARCLFQLYRQKCDFLNPKIVPFSDFDFSRRQTRSLRSLMDCMSPQDPTIHAPVLPHSIPILLQTLTGFSSFLGY